MRRLLVCILFTGCGGDGSGGPVELDNLGMELGVASCGKQFDCCTDGEIATQYMGVTFEGQPITTEDQCVAFATAVFTTFGAAQYKDSLAMGRIAYDADAAGDCIAAIEGLSCAQYSAGAVPTSGSGCRPFILPQVADGGECAQDYECTSDNCVNMVCTPMPGEGDACTDNCADGLYCALDFTTSMDICQALKADGADCTADRECTSENCDDTSHTCAPKPATCTGA